MDVSKFISELLSEREDVDRAIMRLERFERLSLGTTNAQAPSWTEAEKGSNSKQYRRNRPATVRSKPQSIPYQSRSNSPS
jgi:hypothetical protein